MTRGVWQRQEIDAVVFVAGNRPLRCELSVPEIPGV